MITSKYFNHEEKAHINQHEKHGQECYSEYHHKLDLVISDEHHKIDVKRIVVEAIDINWIFHGDNMKLLIVLLKREKVSSFFATKAIRSFVMLTWGRYRHAIIRYILIPNLLYLFSFITLTYLVIDDIPTLNDIHTSDDIMTIELPFLFLLVLNLTIAMFIYWIEL